MGRFFLESDFKAFDSNLARSTDERVIANRMHVVNKFKDLHEQGLNKFTNSNGLNSHWKKEHLTNVIWPLKQANGECVNYIRMGYGKSKPELKELSKIAELFNVNEKGFMKDDMAFHCITQLQISLNEESWNVSLYIDKKGWLEQNNLVKKIANKEEKDELIKLIKIVYEQGYKLYLYSKEKGNYYYEDAEGYVDEIISYSNNGVSFSVDIAKEFDIEDEENDLDKILLNIINEFNELMPLYKFIAWNYKINNYLLKV